MRKELDVDIIDRARLLLDEGDNPFSPKGRYLPSAIRDLVDSTYYEGQASLPLIDGCIWVSLSLPLTFIETKGNAGLVHCKDYARYMDYNVYQQWVLLIRDHCSLNRCVRKQVSVEDAYKFAVRYDQEDLFRSYFFIKDSADYNRKMDEIHEKQNLLEREIAIIKDKLNVLLPKIDRFYGWVKFRHYARYSESYDNLHQYYMEKLHESMCPVIPVADWAVEGTNLNKASTLSVLLHEKQVENWALKDKLRELGSFTL